MSRFANVRRARAPPAMLLTRRLFTVCNLYHTTIPGIGRTLTHTHTRPIRRLAKIKNKIPVTGWLSCSLFYLVCISKHILYGMTRESAVGTRDSGPLPEPTKRKQKWKIAISSPPRNTVYISHNYYYYYYYCVVLIFFVGSCNSFLCFVIFFYFSC